ncbi:MAG: hypothetical protein LBD94_01905 [Rickettsiales bacterium]|jgi:hypothetical protein|nr:hypothetical protein [Rickettsiales bacterium]
MKTKLVYISGGECFAPAEIKSALDEIRHSLDLPSDIVLFGLPIDGLADGAAADTLNEKSVPSVPDHKILQFPNVRRKSILNVIENPTASITHENNEHTYPAKIVDEPLVVSNNDDDEESSITALLDGLPSMNEDELPKKPDLAEEFDDFLDKEEAAEKAAPAKKPKPFGRKGKNPFNNLLGDLFSYAGIAANEDVADFTLPDFIKRP